MPTSGTSFDSEAIELPTKFALLLTLLFALLPITFAARSPIETAGTGW